jgi:hypothetical protein
VLGNCEMLPTATAASGAYEFAWRRYAMRRRIQNFDDITARKVFFVCRDLNVDPLASNRAANKHNSPIG